MHHENHPVLIYLVQSILSSITYVNDIIESTENHITYTIEINNNDNCQVKYNVIIAFKKNHLHVVVISLFILSLCDAMPLLPLFNRR